MSRRDARIEIDDTELRVLGVDLAGAPGRLQRRAPDTLNRRVGPALAHEMRVDATGHRGNYFGIEGTDYAIHLERHVSHEMRGLWEVEAGIEYEGVGKLAEIIVTGSVNNEPTYDFMAGPRRALPRIEAMLMGVVEDAVLGGAE